MKFVIEFYSSQIEYKYLEDINLNPSCIVQEKELLSLKRGSLECTIQYRANASKIIGWQPW